MQRGGRPRAAVDRVAVRVAAAREAGEVVSVRAEVARAKVARGLRVARRACTRA